MRECSWTEHPGPVGVAYKTACIDIGASAGNGVEQLDRAASASRNIDDGIRDHLVSDDIHLSHFEPGHDIGYAGRRVGADQHLVSVHDRWIWFDMPKEVYFLREVVS